MKKLSGKLSGKLSLFLCLLLIVLSVLQGCSGKGSDDAAGTSEPTEATNATKTPDEAAAGEGMDTEIHIAVNAVPETFDLTKTSATIGATIALGSVYECLVALGADYSIIPELAETFEMNADATEYVYHLRQGVPFHNGEEMKAGDVVASMNRWIDSFGTAQTMIGDARFEEVDDYTVKITMDHPLLYLNELLTTASQRPIIVPKSVIDNADPATGNIREYIGTGPFKFEEWATDQYVLFTKFDDYAPYGTSGELNGWAGYKAAATQKVYYDIVPDDSTRVAGIQSGEYDVAYNMPVDNYDLFKNSEDYQVYSELDGDLVMVYNKKEGVAANTKFRQAVNAALNVDDILLAAYANPDFYKVNSSYMSVDKSEWYTDLGKEYYNVHDAEKVNQLLGEAGYGGESFRILVSSDYMDFYNAAVVIEQQLKEAGINTELVVTDWATYLNYSKDPTQFDAFITSFSIKAVPSLILYLSDTWNGWATDPVIVNGIAEINFASVKEAAINTWHDLQEYCWKEGIPASKIGDKYVYSVVSSKVKNMDYFQGPHAWNVVVEQ